MEHVEIGQGDILFGKYENYSIRIVMTEGRYYTWDESIAGGGIYIIDLTKHQNKTSFLLNGHKHPTCLKRQVM